MKSTKKSLIMSTISLVLCFAMLLGSTYAWFTDEVTSGTNQIKAGNLDVELLHTSASVTTATSVKDETNLFTDKTGNAMLWEPGAVSYENFTVSNVGTLAFKYNMSLNITDYNAVTGTTKDLREPLKVKVLTGDQILSTVTRDTVAALDWTDAKALADFKKDGGTLYPTTATGKTSSEAFQVIVYWQPTDNDNQWNVNNGKTTTDGEPLFIKFGVNLVATQLKYENDSFGDDYDANVITPNLPASINKIFESAPIAGTTYDTGAESVKVVNKNDNSSTVATVPATAVKAIVEKAATLTENLDTTKDVDTVLYLSVTTNSEDVKAGTASYNIDLTAVMTYTDNTGASKSVNLTSEQVDNVLGGEIVTAVIRIGKGLKNVTVKHGDAAMTKLDSAETNAVGYYYDSAYPDLTIKTGSFSPFKVEYEVGEAVACVVNGDQKVGYYTFEEAIAAAQANDTVVLLQNITISKRTEISGKTITLDANGKTVNYTTAGDNVLDNEGLIRILGGSNVTVTGNGNFTHTSGTWRAGYCFTVYDGSTLTIKNGTYYADCTIVQAGSDQTSNKKGTVYIEGGDFKCENKYDNKYWTLNKMDNTNSIIQVTGGTFHGFDPSNGQTENPNDNFVATGYKVTKNEETGVYTVAEIPVSELPLWSDYADQNGVAIDETNKTVAINTAEGLAWFANSVSDVARGNQGPASETSYQIFKSFYKYTVSIEKDIDLGGKRWVPIYMWLNGGAYELTIDGKGHAIKNMKTWGSDAGFIKQTASLRLTIKDLTFDSSVLTGGGDRIGVVIGQMYGGITLNNVDVKNAIIGNGSSSRIGALIGQICNEGDPLYLNIDGCDVIGCTINGNANIGGMVGNTITAITATNCTIKNCDITGSTNVGKFANTVNSYNGVTIENVTVNTPNT